jgi:tRNA 2-selenouridine synthase SelU
MKIGQRSRSLATILSEIGFDVFLLDGGYNTYRKWLKENLIVLPEKFSYRVISGTQKEFVEYNFPTSSLCLLPKTGRLMAPGI